MLAALAVAAAGFILLNLTFILNALFFRLIGVFVREETENLPSWLPSLRHLLFLAVVILISWPILGSRLKPLFKAIYLTVPTAVLFVTVGLFLYQWPVVVFILCFLITVGALYYFYRRHLSWLYYYTVLLVGAVLAVFLLLGGEI